jgi:hypothetical protein
LFQEAPMTHSTSSDILFDTCAIGAIVACGAAFATLVYVLFTTLVSIAGTSLAAAEAAARGL